MDCATRVLVPLDKAIGSMNSIDTRLTATWCPATAVSPMRAMKIAMNEKPVTSTISDKPIGKPRRDKAASEARCGRHAPGRPRWNWR